MLMNKKTKLVFWGLSMVVVVLVAWFFLRERGNTTLLKQEMTKSDVHSEFLKISSPMSQYCLFMSSVPGVPIEGVCNKEVDGSHLEIIYSAEKGSFTLWQEGYTKQMNHTCTLPYNDHTVYWAPYDTSSGKGLLEDREIAFKVTVRDTMTGEVVYTEEHLIMGDGLYYALDQMPTAEQYEQVMDEGLAFYPVTLVDEPVNGQGGLPQKTGREIGLVPIFTEADLLFVDWTEQKWFFKPSFLESLEGQVTKFGDNNDNSPSTLDIEGADLLGDYDQFVVVLDGESIYEGYFQPSMYASFLPVGPVIHDVEEKGIKIELNDIEDGPDKRYDERIQTRLKEKGLLVTVD